MMVQEVLEGLRGQASGVVKLVYHTTRLTKSISMAWKEHKVREGGTLDVEQVTISRLLSCAQKLVGLSNVGSFKGQDHLGTGEGVP